MTLLPRFVRAAVLAAPSGHPDGAAAIALALVPIDRPTLVSTPRQRRAASGAGWRGRSPKASPRVACVSHAISHSARPFRKMSPRPWISPSRGSTIDGRRRPAPRYASRASSPSRSDRALTNRVPWEGQPSCRPSPYHGLTSRKRDVRPDGRGLTSEPRTSVTIPWSPRNPPHHPPSSLSRGTVSATV